MATTSKKKEEENIYEKVAKDFGFKSEEELKAKIGEKLSPSDIEMLSRNTGLGADNTFWLYLLLLFALGMPFGGSSSMPIIQPPVYINIYNTEPKECKCEEK